MHKLDLSKVMVLLLALLAAPAFAHNIVGGVYAIGDLIEGEVGFSDGEMGQAGVPVMITDAQGNKLGETVVEEEGLFSFQAQQRIDHHFKIDLGAGHVLNTMLSADELPDSLPGGDQQPANATSTPAGNGNVALSGADAAALQQMIERSVSKQIVPLRKELQAYKEKAGLQDILGGIGYIFGLCGVGMWLRQRKQQKQG